MKYQFYLTFIVSILLFSTTKANTIKLEPECTQTRSYTSNVTEDCGNGLTVTTSFTSTQTATGETCEAAATAATNSAHTVATNAAVSYAIMCAVNHISNCP